MKPQSNGIVELHDAKQKERGFNCMQLIRFLTEDGVKDWDEWHGAHLEAAVRMLEYLHEPKNRKIHEITEINNI